jgi:glutamine amidotransferase
MKKDHYLFEGVKKDADFYFVHSYYFDVFAEEIIIANCQYGFDFPAVVGCNNLTGIQFHPEKSQKNGLKILENFAFNESIY